MVFVKRLAAALKNESALMAVVILAASCMILINNFTIKTLSAARAYSNGESRYSKGQKDAARNLIMFVNTGEELYWNSYLEEISVPLGDSIARVGLINDADESIIRNGFLAGRNHPDDIDDLSWMFRNFQNISFMKKAIQIWKEADYLVGEELKFAYAIKQKSEEGKFLPAEKTDIIMKINDITAQLTIKERAFSDTIGEASRDIRSLLSLVNVIMTLLIIGGTFLFARLMFGRLREKNNALISANDELDKFVYMASHDLRAPITSLQGLIGLARQDPAQLAMYLELMEHSLTKQDIFIRDIIDLSRNKKTSVSAQVVDLTKLIDDAVEQHRFMDSAKGIDIRKDIRAKKLKADELRIKVILNNLLSNAIKYSDPKKDHPMITIRTSQNNGSLVLEVEDNGLGIKEEDQAHVFEMFFVINSGHKGTGLGLYIAHETVQKLKGKITVDSQLGVGTTFSIELPNHHVT
jgi:signal transduction histidine kinase